MDEGGLRAHITLQKAGALMFDLLHPKLVHLPMALSVLMPLVSVVVLLAWRLRVLPRAGWGVAILLQGILVASGAAAMNTGEADEERVERFVPESALEAHEEAAEVFVWGAGGVLLLTLAVLALKKDSAAQALGALAAVGTVVVLGLGYRVGEAGGALVYQHGAARAFVADAAGAPPAAPGRQTDDD